MMNCKKCEKKMSVISAMRLVVCALHLTVTFLVLSFKKRSPWQAILLLASTGVTMGALLLPEEKLEATVARRKAKKTPAEPSEDGADEDFEEMMNGEDEIFTEEESIEAEAQMRETLSGNSDEEAATAPSAKREIPRDEEASEADFQ